MITREKIDGKDATVSYLNEKWEPVEPLKAVLVKVVFDNGDVIFGTPKAASNP